MRQFPCPSLLKAPRTAATRIHSHTYINTDTSTDVSGAKRAPAQLSQNLESNLYQF